MFGRKYILNLINEVFFGNHSPIGFCGVFIQQVLE